jgi:predicted DNA-binding protein (MmcQ/YjbR family)
MNLATVEKLRKICLALPETIETSAFGHPNFKANKKAFVTYENFKGQDSIAFRVDPLQFDAMLLDPRFFATPYGRGQWLSMPANAALDWALVKDLVASSYRLVANKRMLANLSDR